MDGCLNMDTSEYSTVDCDDSGPRSASPPPRSASRTPVAVCSFFLRLCSRPSCAFPRSRSRPTDLGFVKRHSLIQPPISRLLALRGSISPMPAALLFLGARPACVRVPCCLAAFGRELEEKSKQAKPSSKASCTPNTAGIELV